jgi:hypothetical protein
MRRPLDWPRYMKARRLADGSVGYYWVPHERDVAAGFTLAGEPLGKNYGEAMERAQALNGHLDAWREHQAEVKNVDNSPRFGSLTWLFERYRRSAAFGRVSQRSRPEYLRALQRLEDLPTRDDKLAGALPVSTISARAADKMYEAVRSGPRARGLGKPIFPSTLRDPLGMWCIGFILKRCRWKILSAESFARTRKR